MHKPAISEVCRFCGSNNISYLFKFGRVPISRNFQKGPNLNPNLIDIDICNCNDCGLTQMSKIPDLSELYSSAFYSTSFQKPKHLDDLISTAICYSKMASVLDVGCNDGALMKKLISSGFEKVIGIEPNNHPAMEAIDKGLDVYVDYLDDTSRSKMLKTHGNFSCVFARHVAEHVDEPLKFFEHVYSLLENKGIFVLELPDVEAGFKATNPAIIWEEHLNYFSRSFLENNIPQFGFEILEKRSYVFGGGAIAYVLRKNSTKKVVPLTPKSQQSEELDNFVNQIESVRSRISSLVINAKQNGWSLLVYGAGPRTSTFINFSGIAHEVDFLIDDRAELSGFFLPNIPVPVMEFQRIETQQKKLLVFLGVGAENDHKIKTKMLKTGKIQVENCGFLSMFHPCDLLEQIHKLEHLLAQHV